MKIVTVIPFKDVPTKEDLTYFSSKDVKIGDLVSAQIRNKNTLGLVINTEEIDEVKSNIKKMPFTMKKIIEVKEKSLFDKRFINSILKTSDYFLISKSKIAEMLIPAILKAGYDKFSEFYKENKNIEKNNLKLEKLLLQSSLIDRISIYKTLIRASFAEKKSVFMVLPGEKDVEMFYKELSKGIESFTIGIHSGITSKKASEKIKDILTNEHPLLVLATAPFLSIPREDLGTIILEQEGSSQYKTIKKPSIDLRTFVEIFASNIQVKLILADTMLRFETIARSELDGFSQLYPLSFRTNFENEIILSERKKDESKKQFTTINEDTLEEISKILKKKGKVFIFSLRKGLATHTICRDCGDIITCDNCLTPLVLYTSKDKKKRMFVCNKCGNQIDSDINCKNCGSWNLLPLGIGTETVFEELHKNFKKEENLKIFKIDKDSIKNEKEIGKIMKEFNEEGPRILVGTEMALPYIEKKIDLSVISSFDSLWNIPSFRMSEKITRLMLSIISKTEKKIIIQTKNKNDGVIKSILEENFSSFVKEEIEERKKLNYPPFFRFIKITYIADKKNTEKARIFLQETLKEYSPEVFSGFIQKQKEKYVTNALIRIESKKWSLKELSLSGEMDEKLKEKLLELKKEFIVSVDPEDLL